MQFSPMPPVDVQQLLARHGTALQALARELLGDGNARDDALQETWRRTLQMPPRAGEGLGAWLATVLRHVVWRARRGDARRRRHEAAAAAHRSSTSGSDADVAATLGRLEETRRLVAAVESLDAPYREVVLRRWFDGWPPRRIAAERAVPVATVKSQLQRGLALLRTQLATDAADRDWRAGLFAVVGAAKIPAVAAAGTTAAMEVTAMASMAKTKCTVGALVAAAVVSTAVVVWPQMVADAPVGAPIDAPVAAATPAGDPSPSGDAAAPAPARTAAAVPVAVPVTVHGRCIDAAGAPLAGIAVTFATYVRDWYGNERWRIAHLGEPAWSEPEPTTTGADGAFRALVAPPPSSSGLTLQLGDASHAGVMRRWPAARAGADLDAGTVVLQAGGELTGRVLDAGGRGVAGCTVSLGTNAGKAVTAAAEATFVAAASPVVSAPDGAFAFAMAVPPGDYRLSGGDSLGHAGPVAVTVVTGQRTAVDVPWQPRYSAAAIVGRLIDHHGQPVASASLGAMCFGRLSILAYSAADGRFFIDPSPMLPPDGLRFTVWKNGCELLETDALVPWGTRDLVLTLRRGTPITFVVVDEADRPVTDYALRVFSTAGHVWGSGSLDVWSGPHADGVVRVDVGQGAWTVLVEYAARLGLSPTVTELEVQRGVGRTVRLRASRLHERWMRLVTRAGTPIAGSTVRLCAPRDPSAGWEDIADWVSAFSQSGGAPAALVQRGVTDAEGRLRLRGPADRRLGLLVEGPTHLPVRVVDVALTEAEELRVVADGGGTVRGRLAPMTVLADLQRLVAGSTPGDAKQPPLAWIGFVDMPRQRSVPSDFDAPTHTIAADGTFEVRQLPAGRWRVQLRFRNPPGLREGRDQIELGQVDVPVGGEVEFTGDLRPLAFGTLVGEVVRGGRPHAGEQLVVEREPAPGAPEWAAQYVNTDAAGRFTMPARVGAYRVSQWGLQSGSFGWFAREVAVVHAGATTRQSFVLAVGSFTATIADAAGQPVAGAELWLAPDDPAMSWALLRADANGSLRAEVPAQGYRLLLPAVDPAAHARDRSAAATPDGREALRRSLRDVGGVTVVDGQTATASLRLLATK